MTEIHRLQLEYAEKQPWFPQFVSNTVSMPLPDPLTVEETIVNTFLWKSSPEGDDFWLEINEELENLFIETTNVQEILDLYPKDKYPEYYI